MTVSFSKLFFRYDEKKYFQLVTQKIVFQKPPLLFKSSGVVLDRSAELWSTGKEIRYEFNTRGRLSSD